MKGSKHHKRSTGQDQEAEIREGIEKVRSEGLVEVANYANSRLRAGEYAAARGVLVSRKVPVKKKRLARSS